MSNDYNGWSNYETWNVKLWIDNDEGSYRYWQDEADAAYSYCENEDEAARRLARQLKEEISEAAPDLGASCYADLLNAALSDVDAAATISEYIRYLLHSEHRKRTGQPVALRDYDSTFRHGRPKKPTTPKLSDSFAQEDRT